jgi:hypothetical protein
MRVLAAVAFVVTGLMAGSCGGIIDPSKNTVDTFNDTLPIAGRKAHSFSSSKTGEISVKITALAPISNTYVGIIWSQALSDGTCSPDTIGGIYQQNAFAQLGLPAISGQITEGKYCLIVYDSVTLAQAETYTVTVSHP